MRFSTLHDWLSWQEQLHPATIELGLDRVREVWRRLGEKRPARHVITVAGTNGKGSSVAVLEAIARAAGYRVGAYTSPHLLRYNERVRIGAREASDRELMRAFAEIDAARGDISLTYFEFGTLAALRIFAAADLDLAVLEVGLGGRLDAVNIIDADVALITPIGLDHTEWLGADRESIGREKAGIMRAGMPVVCNDAAPPQSVLRYAAEIAARLSLLGRDYDFRLFGAGWTWRCGGRTWAGLPRPGLLGPHQYANAAGALMALHLLSVSLPVSRGDIAAGLAAVRLPGRFQPLDAVGMRVVDVAHNPHGAEVLAGALRERPAAGRTHAVWSMLNDKDVAEAVRIMAPLVDVWHVAPLATPRAAPVERLAGALQEQAPAAEMRAYTDIVSAWQGACAAAAAHDRVIAWGSFHTVAAVLQTQEK